MVFTPQQGLWREKVKAEESARERGEPGVAEHVQHHSCLSSHSIDVEGSFVAFPFDVAHTYMYNRHVYYNWMPYVHSLVATYDLVRVGARTVCITLVHDCYTLKIVDKVIDTTVDLSSLGAA
jgi:hypothetical protein